MTLALVSEAFGVSPYEYLHGDVGRLAIDFEVFRFLADARRKARENLGR